MSDETIGSILYHILLHVCALVFWIASGVYVWKHDMLGAIFFAVLASNMSRIASAK